MSGSNERPVILSIGGSESGGGAGIQADLKAITAMGGWGTTAVTCIISQNPKGVRSVQGTDPSILADQIDVVCEEFEVRAVKTGILYSAELIRVVVDRLLNHQAAQLVVDPVMVAESGQKLLPDDAIAALKDELIPMAMLVTPNLLEASILTGRDHVDLGSGDDAAASIHDLGVANVLIKGGHLEGDPVDTLSDGDHTHRLWAPRIDFTFSTHGAGCILASAIATGIANGMDVPDATLSAKKMVTRAIENRAHLGGGVEAPDPFWSDRKHDVVVTL